MKLLRLEGAASDLTRMVEHFSDGAHLTELNARERCVSFDNSILRGRANSLSLESGVHMTVTDLQGRQNFSLPVELGPTELEFGFCRGSGVVAKAATGEDLSVSPGQFQVCSVRKATQVQLAAPAGTVEQSIRLNLTVSALCRLLGTEEIPRALQGMLSPDVPCSSRGFHLNRRIDSIVGEIFEASSSTSTGRGLYLQGKTMELLALVSDQLNDESADNPVSEEQLEKLHRAKDILLTKLDSPPSVSELARLIRMGERQLKQGFKAVFGAPVMTYVRQLKMERARTLLTGRKYNVTEVAGLIGYANPSKFAAAYRRQFGVSPSTA